MKEIIATSKAPEAIGPYSQAVKVGDLLFTAGQIPLDPDGSWAGGDITEQTTRVMENLKGILDEVGVGFDRVVKTTCFLTTMDDFAAFNEVYGRYMSEGLPARSTVAVAGLPKGALVEVEAVVYLG